MSNSFTSLLTNPLTVVYYKVNDHMNYKNTCTSFYEKQIFFKIGKLEKNVIYTNCSFVQTYILSLSIFVHNYVTFIKNRNYLKTTNAIGVVLLLSFVTKIKFCNCFRQNFFPKINPGLRQKVHSFGYKQYCNKKYA